MSVPVSIGEKLIGLIIAFCIINKFFGIYVAVGFVVIVFSVTLFILHQKNQVWKKLGVPGPQPKILLGNFDAFTEGIHTSDVKWSKKYGKVFGTFTFTQPDLVVSDVDLLKQFLVKDFSNFTNRRNISFFSSRAKNLAAKLLSLLKDDEWKNIRNSVTPAFTGGKLKNMEHQFQGSIQTLMEIVQEKAKTGENVDAKGMFSACTLDIIAACAFATKIDCQRNPDDAFLKYAKKANEINFKSLEMAIMFLFPWTLFQLNRFFGITLLRRDIEDFFTQTLTKIMNERKRNPMTKNPDFLQIVLNATEVHQDKVEIVQDEAISHDLGLSVSRRVPLTDHDVMSNSFLFLIAGFETTALSITMISYMLAQNPVEQQKLHEEIKTVCPNGEISINDVTHKMPYLEAVISETLRLFPPAPRFDRNTKEDYDLNGIMIPKGAAVSVSVYTIHHSEEHYPDPEKFLPDRFLPDEKTRRNPLTYLPFGFGPRNCIGMRFAQLEMKMILANILYKYKFVATDKTEPYPPKLMTTNLLKPVTPVCFKIEAID